MRFFEGMLEESAGSLEGNAVAVSEEALGEGDFCNQYRREKSEVGVSSEFCSMFGCCIESIISVKLHVSPDQMKITMW